jgi:AraC-like DNA-binding protein
MKTPIFNIHDLILVLTLSGCVLLAIFQLLLSKQKQIASRLLALFFATVGVSAFCNLLLWNDYLNIHAPLAKVVIAYGIAISVISKGVCLYLYIVASTREDFHLRTRDALHLLSLIPALGLLMAGGLDSDKLRYISSDHSALAAWTANNLWNYLKVIPVFYAATAVWVASRYKQQLKEFYSTLSLEGPQWLMLLTLGFALSWSWSLLVHILGQSVGMNLADSLGIFDNYITFILVNAFFVYSLLYAHQLLETKHSSKDKPPVATDEPSPDLLARIQHGMETQQLYLRQNLNIEEFARHVGIHFREVSTIINKHFDTNFFEFVNSYRVNKAKAMLVDPAFADTTILDILMESGFNSKSAFHRFFKRYTGMTAADFRKQHAAELASATTKK